MRQILVILGALVFAGCTPRAARGPSLGDGAHISKVVIERVKGIRRAPVVATDQKTLDLAERLFSDDEWEENDDALVPAYSVQVFTASGERYTYWIGTFSDLHHFPCYWFCSGWWLAASDADGTLRSTIYKPFLTSGAMFAVFRFVEAASAS